MNLRFSVFEVLVLIGVTQGFITAALIWRKQRTHSKVLLSFILLVFNLLCIKILLHTTGLWQTRWFRYFPLPFELAIQPLLWLYICSVTSKNSKGNSYWWVHFVPFMLSFGYSSMVYMLTATEVNLLQKDAIANGLAFNTVKETEDYLTIVSSVAYWIAGYRRVAGYRKWLYTNISDTNYPTYTWLRNLLVLMCLLVVVLAIDIVLDYFFGFSTLSFMHWQVFFIYMAALVYYLGFKGFQQEDEQVSHPQKENPLAQYAPQETSHITTLQEAFAEPAELDQTEVLAETKEAEAFTINNPPNEQLKDAVVKALQMDKKYKDPELSLDDFARHLDASPALVSSVINTAFQKNFRSLINEYRVAEVKKRLSEASAKQYSMLGIAYDCGFNSEASFYRIFKNVAGISPKAYVQQQQEGEAENENEG